jgi:hypothetical protein
MDLFEQVDLFYKLATQELVAEADAGTIMPSNGYPHQSIRAMVNKLLNELNQNPNSLAHGSLQEYLKDFVNERFSDKNLDYHWDNYLSSLMDHVSMAKQKCATKDVCDDYQHIFDQLSDLWDQIAGTEGWTSHVTKPIVLPWNGSKENGQF